MAEGGSSKRERSEEDQIVVRFADAKYRVPLFAARKIPRLAFVLKDTPDVEDVTFNECDLGRGFAHVLATVLPPVDISLFTGAPNVLRDERDAFCEWFLYEICSGRSVYANFCSVMNSTITSKLNLIEITSGNKLHQLSTIYKDDTSDPELCILIQRDWLERHLNAHASFVHMQTILVSPEIVRTKLKRVFDGYGKDPVSISITCVVTDIQLIFVANYVRVLEPKK